MSFFRSIVFIAFLIELIPSNVLAQLYRGNAWRRYRKEVTFQIGASGFLGDLGGRNFSGTDFSPADYELNATRVAIGMGYKYKLSKEFNLHTSFNYLMLSGDDKLTQEKYRNNRNLNFKTNLYEFGTRLEFSLTALKQSGIYNLKSHLTRTKKRRYNELIAFVGVAGFYFNPKGKNPNTDEYVNLYPLHTEGQGLPGGPKQYKRIGIAIPLGMALRTVINKTWSIGAEFCYRITFTDYLDDVSTRYYDKQALAEAYGTESAVMADPSKGIILGASSPAADGTSAQRGDKNKDSYMSFQITVGRLIKSKRGGGRTKLRSKF